eukprot:COSAG02_NODE_6556_length_3499_cov_1.878235_4_plen_67_part_00
MWTARVIRYNITDEDGVDEGVVFWEDLKEFTHGRDDETSTENRCLQSQQIILRRYAGSGTYCLLND